MKPRQPTNPITKLDLWDAAQTGKFPVGTTLQMLSDCKDHKGWSALECAVHYGHYPAGTTATDLAQYTGINARSILHYSVFNGHLPPNTTADLLKATKDAADYTAWQSLLNFLNAYPHNILRMPAALFQNDTAVATKTINAAIAKTPELQSAATIWLGHVLAANPVATGQTRSHA